MVMPANLSLPGRGFKAALRSPAAGFQGASGGNTQGKLEKSQDILNNSESNAKHIYIAPSKLPGIAANNFCNLSLTVRAFSL